jgi:hypothetical protein
VIETREQAPARLGANPLTLIAAAVGGPRQIAGKLRRVAATLRLYLDPGEIPQRLRTLESAGLIERRPSRIQILFGGLDMLRFLIEPAARDYYQQRGIHFGFHQLLRFLDDPVSMIDPTGFLSTRDTIIGHVMQVVHLDPIYDLQLLSQFSDGLAELERQLGEVLEGTHPRAASLDAIVEEADYHARLLDYVRRFRRDPATARMPRQDQTLRQDPSFAAAEETFATLPGFIAYCAALPASPVALLRRLAEVKRFPVA